MRGNELSRDTILKTTGIELGLISDIDMDLFIEKGMRGIPYITKRFSKANIQYMQSYDNKKPSKYIKYFDANNLHGSVMSEYLPYSRLKWLNRKIS